MDKSETLNLKINPTLKTDPVESSKPPADIDMTQMTEEQLHDKLQQGYNNYKGGKTRKAEDVLKTKYDKALLFKY